MRTFEPNYNPVMALEAFRRVKEAVPDARLTMAGQDRGLMEHVSAHARAIGLADDVSFPGFLDEHQKRAAFSEHDIFLNTNKVDNAPVSVLEAAVSGLIVVATAVGGVDSLFDHERSALLVPDGDYRSAAAAVERLLGDASLCGGLSEGGRRVAERSSWESVGPQWEELFESVVRRR
jgi:glycosyltransferase involved in cell wall biosynthesis